MNNDLTTRPLAGPEIARFPVVSSLLAEVGYDEASKTLEVKFKDGRNKPGAVWRYFDVPAWVFEDLIDGTGGSRGRLFTKVVKNGGYDGERVDV